MDFWESLGKAVLIGTEKLREAGQEIDSRSKKYNSLSDRQLYNSGSDFIDHVARSKVLNERTNDKYDRYDTLSDAELINKYRNGDISDKRATKRLLQERGYGRRDED